MPRSSVPAFINGDRCEDGAGSIGYVRSCNGRRGSYLKVCVSQGARTGQWEWPEKFCRRPSIDWDRYGQRAVCVDCEREFYGDRDARGLKRLWCKTCEGLQSATYRRRAADASPSHSFGANRPRVYRRTPTDDVEDQIAAATRGQS